MTQNPEQTTPSPTVPSEEKAEWYLTADDHEHRFWKDSNPDGCFTCNRTREELREAKVLRRIHAAKAEARAEMLNEAIEIVSDLTYMHMSNDNARTHIINALEYKRNQQNFVE